MKIARLWALVCLAGIAVGCGQKGPLVLPDAPKHKKVLPSQRAPARPVPPAFAAPAPAGAPGDPAPVPTPAPAGTGSATDTTPKP